MKVLLKILAVLTAALCAAMFAFGVFGYDTRYGDVTTTVIRGADDLLLSGDFAETKTTSFKASDGVTLTDAQLKAAAACFEQRMSYFTGILADYRVAVDYAERTVWVTIPSSENDDAVMSYLLYEMGFEAHTGSEQTPETLIFDERGITSLKAHSEAGSNGQTVYSAELKLTDEAREKYAAATKTLVDEYNAGGEQGFISYWFNDSLLSTVNVKDEYTGGTLSVSSGVTASTLEQMLIILNSEPLPAVLTLDKEGVSPARLGDAIIQILVIAGCAAFAAIAAWLIARYRLGGFIAALCTLGTFGGVIAVISGFYSAPHMTFTLAALAGVVAVVFISLESSLRDCEAVKNAFPSKSGTPVATALRSTLGGSAMGYAVLLVIGLALMLLTRQQGLLFNAVSGAMGRAFIDTLDMSEFGVFGKILLFGTLISACFNIFGERIMLLAASNCAGLKKASLYGGKSE